MNESTSARGSLPRATGVIDSLSAGFGVVNQQPWIVLVPVLLDLFFLFGPQVSVAPLVSRAVTSEAFARSFGTGGSADAVRAQAIAAAEEINLLALLSPGGVSVPGIVPLLGIGRGPLTFVDSAAAAFGIGLAALLLGALLGCVYRAFLAQLVRGQTIAPAALPREAVAAWGRVVLLALLLIAAMLLVVVPLAFVAALASLVAAGATAIMTAVVVTVTLIAQIYLFFAPDAIFVSRVGPIQAVRRSVSVVQSSVWSAVTLVVLITLIVVGMAQVWRVLAGQASWGLALGIVGNAYIASGLAAASMLFYRERMDALLARRSMVPAREA